MAGSPYLYHGDYPMSDKAALAGSFFLFGLTQILRFQTPDFNLFQPASFQFLTFARK